MITVPISLRKFVSWQSETPENVLAPVHKGEQLGKALITAKHEVLKSIALLADREVPQGGLLKRMVHTLAIQGKEHKMSLLSVFILFPVLIWFLWLTSRRRQNRRRRYSGLSLSKRLLS